MLEFVKWIPNANTFMKIALKLVSNKIDRVVTNM